MAFLNCEPRYNFLRSSGYLTATQLQWSRAPCQQANNKGEIPRYTWNITMVITLINYFEDNMYRLFLVLNIQWNISVPFYNIYYFWQTCRFIPTCKRLWLSKRFGKGFVVVAVVVIIICIDWWLQIADLSKFSKVMIHIYIFLMDLLISCLIFFCLHSNISHLVPAITSLWPFSLFFSMFS